MASLMRFRGLLSSDTRAQNDFKEERLQELIARLEDYDVLLLQETWLLLDNGSRSSAA